jgi:hypothetical protein
MAAISGLITTVFMPQVYRHHRHRCLLNTSIAADRHFRTDPTLPTAMLSGLLSERDSMESIREWLPKCEIA